MYHGIPTEREKGGFGHDVACLTTNHRSECLARATRNTSLNMCRMVSFLERPMEHRLLKKQTIFWFRPSEEKTKHVSL